MLTHVRGKPEGAVLHQGDLQKLRAAVSSSKAAPREATFARTVPVAAKKKKKKKSRLSSPCFHLSAQRGVLCWCTELQPSREVAQVLSDGGKAAGNK